MPDRSPFDLSKMQHETNRQQTRRSVLLKSAPVVLIVLLIAIWFILPTLLTGQAITRYKHQKYAAARTWLTPLTWTSPERFVIEFNSGTVDTRLGKYEVAQKELIHALEIAPPRKRCITVQNLVISVNIHANSLLDTGNNELSAGYTKYANSLVVKYRKCFAVSSSGASQSQGGGGGGGASVQAEQELTQAQQQSLQQKSEAGQQSQQQTFKQDVVDPNDPSVKPW